MKKSTVYLASPYTHSNPEVMAERCEATQKAAARLMRAGVTVFSPIAHSHGIANFLSDELRRDTEFWLRQDFPILAHSDELWILCLPGWEDSLGVQTEIAIAHVLDIPVSYHRVE